MKLASINDFDIVDSVTGVNVSVWLYGCPNRCKGCHNQELWDENSREETPNDQVIADVIEKMSSHGPLKGLSVLGGEPLAPYNRKDVLELISAVRTEFQDSVQVYVWTGYWIEDLIDEDDDTVIDILKQVDYLIDGPYIEKLKENIQLRGSSNQRILKKQDILIKFFQRDVEQNS